MRSEQEVNTNQRSYHRRCLSIVLLILFSSSALAEIPWHPMDRNKSIPFGAAVWLAMFPPLAGSARWYDIVGLNHSTLNGALWVGKKITFNGTSNYADMSLAPNFSPTTPFTICLWHYATAAGDGTFSRILMNQSMSPAYAGVSLWWGSNNTTSEYSKPSFLIGSDSGLYEQIRVTTDRSLNIWEFMCAVYDGTQTLSGLSLWFNGFVTPTFTVLNTGFGSFGNNTIRIAADKNLTASIFFQGSIRDLMIFSRALSATEIWNLYTLTRS